MIQLKFLSGVTLLECVHGGYTIVVYIQLNWLDIRLGKVFDKLGPVRLCTIMASSKSYLGFIEGDTLS